MSAHSQEAQQKEKIDLFRKQLVSGKTFILPEAWDVISARILAGLQFPVIGTSAASIAWGHGYPVASQVKLEDLLMVAARIARGAKNPVSADLAACLTGSAEDVARAIRAAITVGCAGVSFSDLSHHRKDLLSMDDVVLRLRRARETAVASGVPLVLTMQMDAFMLKDKAPAALNEAIERTRIYHDAGADCVLISGLHHTQVIEKIIETTSKAVAIAISQSTTTDMRSYQRIGVSYIAVGSTLLRSLLGNLRLKADELKTFGQFNNLDRAISTEEIENLLG